MEFQNVQFKPGDEVCMTTAPRKKMWIHSVNVMVYHVTYQVWDGCTDYWNFEPWQIAKYEPVTE